jgi:DNA polymerase-1
MKHILIIDGNSFIHRSYHGFKNSPKYDENHPNPSFAISGSISMMARSITEQNPDYLALVFDHKEDSFRNDLYPKYKADRPPSPEDLKSQIQPVQDLALALGYPVFCEEGYEADDVIGALTKRANAKNMRTTILTGDKDMCQLVNQNTILLNTMTEVITDEAHVMKKFGIKPYQMVDFLTLLGDDIDGIPGLDRCGEITAKNLLEEMDTLDNLLINPDHLMTTKIRNKAHFVKQLKENQEKILLSKKLATIVTDMEMNITMSNIKWCVEDEPAVNFLLEHHNITIQKNKLLPKCRLTGHEVINQRTRFRP